MDRSFLSQPQVVAASRDFVCVRLATYESAEEADFLASLAPTGSGQLENTVFAILSPDGKQKLVRASRSARQTFGDADRMAKSMRQVAALYPHKGSREVELPALPLVSNLRLAVDIAASDNQPLVILAAEDRTARARLAGMLQRLAWSEKFLGRFVYAEASRKDLSTIGGARLEDSLLIVEPDRFGLKGSLLKQVAATAPAEELASCLETGASLHRKDSDGFGRHAREGHQKGIFWETAIPVTDPMERQARERGQAARLPAR
jgi:hypothetical protein